MKTMMFGLLMIAAAGAGASDFDVRTKPFAEQASAIRSEMREGGKYGEISPEDQAKVNTLLGRMGLKIEPVGDVNRLPAQDQVDVFNDQESVNTILTRAAADSRVVCKRERPTGSNFAVNNCMTVAERRRHTEAGREYMRKAVRSMQRGN
jgi:hypothetical protein